MGKHGWWQRLLGRPAPLETADRERDAPRSVRPDVEFSSRVEPAFAVALYGRLATQPGNLFFSPASIRMALAMAYAGARGRTAEQMATVLCLPPGDEVHAEMAAQLDAWGVPSASDGTPPSSRARAMLRMVNRLWAQRGGPFVEAFLVRLSDSYRAPLGSLDFMRAPELSREAINRWVSEQTAHEIKDMIEPGGIDAATRLVLTNAVLFKGKWTEPFDRSLTRTGTFFADANHAVRVPFLFQSGTFRIAQFPGGQLLELPYGNGELVMDLLLPDARDGLPQIEQQLCQGALAGWLDGAQSDSAVVSIPRFQISSMFNLAAVLRELGMVDAFTSPGASFSGIDGTEELYLSEVLHRAVVEVDEQGTKAAAATTAVSTVLGIIELPEFRADHPFVFLIRDPQSGAIVFLGRVTDPS